ncbi:MAG: UDP-glucose 4-epimerase GalE [Symbiobacteriia bacterium]
MRILVTGGAGYVGSHVVQELLEDGHEPVVYDNLSTGHAQAVQDAELIVGDVADSDRLGGVLRQRPFDGCVHLAAFSLVGESVKDPAKYFHNNVAGGLALFDSLVETGVPWVVLSSTAAVYGEPDSVPILEDHVERPTNPYGESKRILERFLAWYERAYGFRHVALRYFNAAGAHPEGQIGEDHSPETHLIPTVLRSVLTGGDELTVFGTDYPTPDGTAVRDYVHVCDLARAHIAAMDRLHSGAASGVYNLGSQQGSSVLEVIEAARRVTGKEIPVRLAARRAGDPAVLVASSSAAREGLGWAATLSLGNMVETAWRWHSKHRRGYQERVPA